MYTNFVSMVPVQNNRNVTSLIPRLQGQHQTEPGLSPIAVDHRGAPFPATYNASAFEVDDTSFLAPGALSVFDANALPTDGPLFRSGTLASLPTPSLATNTGFISIAPLDPVSFPFTSINASLASAIPGLTLPPGVAITGATIAQHPTTADIALLTVTGTWGTGSPPAGVTLPPAPGPMAFTYTADVVFAPFTDAYDTSLIITATLANPAMTFVAPAGPNPAVTVANSAIGAFLNVLSPVIASLVTRGVQEFLDAEVQTTVLGTVTTLLSAAGVSPAATVSVQRVFTDAAGVNAFPAAGAIGPMIGGAAPAPSPAPSPGPGCGFPLLLLPAIALAAAARLILA